MSRALRLADRALSALVAAASALGALCVAAMMLHVTADVAGRYLLGRPLGGTITVVSHYYMVVLGFVALAVAERRDAHISVDVVAGLMPAAARRGLDVLAGVAAVAVFGLLAARTGLEAADKAALGASVQQGTAVIPVWPSYFALPAGCGLMALLCARKLLGRVGG